MDRHEVGRRIREAREEKGMSQTDLGRLLSKRRTHAAVSQLEHGVTKISTDDLAELGAILGKPIDYFLAPEGAAPVTFRSQERQPSADLKVIESFKAYAREMHRQRQATA